MSVRSDIKANLITTLEAISKLRTVSDKFKEITEVTTSQWPYCMVLPADDEREKKDSSQRTDCIWDIDLMIYCDVDDIETWVETIGEAVMADRSRGSYARDCFVSMIITRQVGTKQQYGLIVMTLEIKYRVREPDWSTAI